MKSFLTALALVALSASPAFACAVCAGDISGTKMSVAAGWGILAMVVIVFVMLSAIIGVGFYFNYRAKNPLPDYSELIGNDGQPKPEPAS